MKKILLGLFLFFGFLITTNAQPANDDCSTAQAIGPLPAPSPCPGPGLGNVTSVAGTLVGATEANPYIYQNGCSGAGGPLMGIPAYDVWYTFVATGYQCQISINSTFANPNVAFYSGTCGALGGGVGGCAVGAGGAVSLTIEQMVPGTTYYIQVSGNTGQTGTFTMNIQNNQDCNNCLIGSTISAFPPPINGMYQPGQVVNFCYTVNDYSEVNTNWLHGVQVTFGAGWSGISGQVGPPPVGGAGTWSWFGGCTQSIAPFNVFGPGFYMDLDGDGNPGNNFGDHCGPGPAPSYIPCPAAASWTFCFNLTVANGCAPGSDLSVTINTSGDGESGSWNNIGCLGDPPTIAPAVGGCCAPAMAAVNISCPGNADGQATATPVGVAPPYDYSWAGPGGYLSSTAGAPGANTITGLSTAGVYTVSITNNLNCVSTATVTVNIGAAPVPVPANTGPYCIGANINLSVGAGFTDWDWTGPLAYNQANTQNPVIPGATLGMAGLYTVTVTNAAGCTGTATTNVVVNPLPVPNATNTGPYCAGATIQLNSVGGSATDDWTGPGGYVANNTQNPTRPASTVAMSGVYTVTVTTGGCSATSTTTVVVNPVPTPVANNTGPYCAGATIQLNSVGGSATDDWTGPLAYNQIDTQNPTIPASTVGMSGIYTVTATAVGGCTATATTNVVVNPNPVANATNTGPYCAGTTIQLNSVGGTATDDWTGPIAYNQLNTQNPTIPGSTVAMSGLYTVTVTTAAGCTSTSTTNVVVNPLPVPVANNTGPYCAGATIQLNSVGGSATDDWAGPLAYNQLNVQNPTLPASTVGMSGVYTVTATAVGGCTATATTNVVVNAVPVPVAANTGPYCIGSNINLSVGAGFTDWDWLGPAGYNQPNTQNPVIVGATMAMNGDYTVTVTNAAGCTATATTTVVVNLSGVIVPNNTGPYCEGSTINLSAPGGATTYDWVGPLAYNQLNMQNPSIPVSTVGMAGIYTVTATYPGGCTSTGTTNVVVDPLPIPFANSNSPICSGIDLLLTSGGGTDYDWTGPGGYSQNNTQNPTILAATVAATGTYTVTVSDAIGCSATATVAVVVNPLPVAVAGNTGPVCDASNVQLTSNGGGVYDWLGPNGYNVPGTQSPVIAGATTNQSGIYTVTVTDGNGCTSTATTNLIINALPVILANSNAPLCNGNNINLNANGAANYNWVGPNGFASAIQNPVIVGAGAVNNGVYTVTGTDANGCTSSTTINIVTFPNPTALFVGGPLSGCAPLCVDFTDQSLGNGAIITTWAWTVQGQNPSGVQNPTFCFPNAGSYDASLTVTTVDGCTSTLTFPNYITVSPVPVASFLYSPLVIQELHPDVTFASTSLGATNWSWDFGDGGFSNIENPLHSYPDTGIYCITLMVSNAAGCSDTTIGCLHVNPEYSLYIPNAFTVNGDGLNEEWMLYGHGIKKMVARIFDRWGEELYVFDDMLKGWPGTRQNGAVCKQDVYVFRVEVTDAVNDEHVIIGRVTLIR